jgi:hypothetical protein
MARKWIKATGIAKHKGALHRALGIPLGKRIPDRTLIAAMHRSGHVGKMARMAGNLRGLHHHHGPLKRRRKVHHKRGR